MDNLQQFLQPIYPLLDWLDAEGFDECGVDIVGVDGESLLSPSGGLVVLVEFEAVDVGYFLVDLVESGFELEALLVERLCLSEVLMVVLEVG